MPDDRYRRHPGRSRPPDFMLAFERHVTAATLLDIPSGCLCTWVPRPKGIYLAAHRVERPYDDRQPWLTRGFALKFINSFCAFAGRHR